MGLIFFSCSLPMVPFAMVCLRARPCLFAPTLLLFSIGTASAGVSGGRSVPSPSSWPDSAGTRVWHSIVRVDAVPASAPCPSGTSARRARRPSPLHTTLPGTLFRYALLLCLLSEMSFVCLRLPCRNSPFPASRGQAVALLGCGLAGSAHHPSSPGLTSCDGAGCSWRPVCFCHIHCDWTRLHVSFRHCLQGAGCAIYFCLLPC